jgi:tetratricopeptide (TPR) repeat protein
VANVNGGTMTLTLKTISTSGISVALEKAQLYRYLNEPEESESICQDILAVDPENQMALRTLGLAITDQFNEQSTERFVDAEHCFRRLTSAYERHYYLGLLHERRAKARARAGHPHHIVAGMFQDALGHFEEAERLRPPDNDEAILRWNRCVRWMETLSLRKEEEREMLFESADSAPQGTLRRAG